MNHFSSPAALFKALFALLLLLFVTPLQAEKSLSHHVTSVKPSSAITIPTGWPLIQGKLACVSCHTDESIADTPADKIDTNAGDFLRAGPYQPLSNFCQNCHQEKSYQAANIHQMLDSKNKPIKRQCLYCHQEMPKPEALISSTDKQAVKLRVNKEKICFGCHLKTPHLNALEHQVTAEKDMLVHLKKSEKQLQVKLPLGQKNQVICISCHSPHQYGVLPTDTATGKQVSNQDLNKGVQYQAHSWNKIVQRDKRDRLKALAPDLEQAFKYQQINHEVLLRLPAKNGQLCLACHTFER